MSNAIKIDIKEHDVWLTFKSKGGKSASLSVAALADGKSGIVGMALREWAAETIEGARHYFSGVREPNVAGALTDTCSVCGQDIRSHLHKRVGE